MDVNTFIRPAGSYRAAELEIYAGDLVNLFNILQSVIWKWNANFWQARLSFQGKAGKIIWDKWCPGPALFT